MARYFILGPNASVFWDPTSRLKVVSSDPENPAELIANMTKRIEQALKANHIQEIKGFKSKAKPAKEAEETGGEETEEEEETPKKKSAPVPAGNNLKKMTAEQLIAYYKENYEATEEDIKNFSAMKPKAMVKWLEDEDLVS